MRSSLQSTCAPPSPQRVLPPAMHPRLAYLSGPSFAAEVAQEQPTAVTIASEDELVAARAQELLSTNRFRCYRATDVIGACSQLVHTGGKDSTASEIEPPATPVTHLLMGSIFCM